MKYTKESLEKRRKKVELIRKSFIALVYIVLLPIIFYNIMIIFQAATNGEETPSVLGVKSFVIISGSMEPELNLGDIIIVKKTDIQDLNTGDIISFRNGESVITHRIKNIILENDGKIKYETKGDNNNISDNSYVVYEDVEGKMLFKIPFIGNLTIMLKNKVVIIIILMIFYVMYMHNAATEEKRLIRKEKRRVLKDKYNQKKD